MVVSKWIFAFLNFVGLCIIKRVMKPYKYSDAQRLFTGKTGVYKIDSE